MIEIVTQKKKVNECRMHYCFKEQVIYMWSLHLGYILVHPVTYEYGIMLNIWGSHQNSQQTEKLLYHLGIYESPEGIDYI